MAPEVVVEPLPADYRDTMRQVRLALSQQSAERALELLAPVASAHPDHPDVLAAQGTAARINGRHAEAGQHLRRALELQPDNARAANDLALLLMDEGSFADAEKHLRQGLGYHPDHALLHYNLAILYEQYLLDLPAALRHYQRYQSLNGEEDDQVAMWIVDLERRVN